MLQVIKEVVISNYHIGTNKVLLGREKAQYSELWSRNGELTIWFQVTSSIPNQLI